MSELKLILQWELILKNLYLWGGWVGSHVTVHVERSEHNSVELVLSFSVYMDPRNLTQDARPERHH